MKFWTVVSLLLCIVDCGVAKLRRYAVESKSVGCHDYCQQNCESYTKINNATFKNDYPSLQIVTLSNQTQLVNNSIKFEYLEDQVNQQTKLKTFLESIEPYTILLMTMHRKCSAGMTGWYKLIEKYGAGLSLKPIDLRNYESAIIIVCKTACPKGNYSQALPLYRLDTLGAGPLSVKINITMELPDDNAFSPTTTTTTTSSSDNNNNNNNNNKSIDDTELIIILAIIATFSVAILTTIILYLCYRKCKRKKLQAKPSLNEITNIKVQNWLRQREQVEINKAIQKTNISSDDRRKEFDNKAYKGDVIRTRHVKVNSFTSFEHLNINVNNENGVYLHENMDDGPGNTTAHSKQNNPGCCSHNTPGHSYETLLSVESSTEVSYPDEHRKLKTLPQISVNQTSSNNRDSIIYLEPVDGHNKSSQDDIKIQSMLKTALMRNRSKSLTYLDNTITLASTSSLLFTSSVSTVDSSSDNTKRYSNHFAEYLVPAQGVIYKSPSNVRKHEPPTYHPERKISNTSNADSHSSHDYEHPGEPIKTNSYKPKVQAIADNNSKTTSQNDQNSKCKESVKKTKHQLHRAQSTEEHYERLKEIYDPDTYKKLDISATDL